MTGKILATLGGLALSLAGLILLGLWQDHNSGSWFPNLMDSILYPMSAIFAVIGAIGVLVGRHMIRKERELREFDEAMKLSNRTRSE